MTFFLLGYAIIQIPDFLRILYAYIEKWLRNRSHAVSNYPNDATKKCLSPEALPKKRITMVSRIQSKKMQMRKANRSQNQTFATGQEVVEWRKETNVRITKLERILKELNRKLQK